jgi:hypothetical protein
MPRKGKTQQKAIKQIVRQELQNELEDKVAVIGLNDVDIPTPSIPNGNVAASANIVRIFPLISQGDGQYNERIGNEIRLKHLDIKMLLNYALANNSTGDNEDAEVGVRVMILKQKDQQSTAGVVTDFQGNKLLENGLTALSAGPAQFTGETFNLLQKINREQFTVKYDKVFYLAAPYRQSSGGATTVSQSFLPPRCKVMSHRMTFGKGGLKLTYGSGPSTDPTNFPYFIAIGYASTVSNSVPSNGLIRYSYTANCKYTDA